MVALLRPEPQSPAREARAEPGSVISSPPRLRLVVDNDRSDQACASSVDRSMVAAIALIAVVVFGGLLFVRVAQGSPAAGTWGDLVDPAASPSVAAAPGDGLITARAGDSYWSIAKRLAPDEDPRPIVTALIAANGGDALQIGQQIVIPQQLLD